MSRTVSTPVLRFSDDAFDLFLDEAERALVDVDSRPDEPNRRFHESDGGPEAIAELRLAIAELADAYPGMCYELEALSERLRSVGVRAAALDLEARPHLVQLVRLSLEVFFRLHPTVDAFEIALRDDDCEEDEDDGPPPHEVWEANRHILRTLSRWTC
jgi:hypothetical protein